MFTGIIEETGIIKDKIKKQSNISFIIESNIVKNLKVGDSISHNGVCLTIEEVIEDSLYQVTAIRETLSKTNLGILNIGDEVNLETSLKANGKIDGHFVQGHIDCVGIVDEVLSKDGSFEYKILYPEIFKKLIIPRGSIALDGISLTISNLYDEKISLEELKYVNQENGIYLFPNYSILFVNIIPHTYKITNVKKWKKGSLINIEFDILGKYIYRALSLEK